MIKFFIRTFAAVSVLLGGIYLITQWMRAHRTVPEYGVTDAAVAAFSLSGPDMAVDHERQPGVPPATNDDYDDPYDRADADSFPASDPPGGW